MLWQKLRQKEWNTIWISAIFKTNQLESLQYLILKSREPNVHISIGLD